MALPVKMPQRGLSEESCIITKWHKKKGDNVKAGDLLFTIETGKSTFDVEAEADGTLIGVFYDEGSEVPVSNYVCVIGNPGENFEEFNPNSQDFGGEITQPDNSPLKNTTAHSETTPEDSPVKVDEGVLKISPRAKNLAAKHGIDFRFATPTGPKGRIIEKDILPMIEKGPSVTLSAMDEYLKLEPDKVISGTGIGGRITTYDIQNSAVSETIEKPSQYKEYELYEEVKLPNIRKVIAKNMYNSLATTAQLTLNTSFDAADILSYRKKIKETREKLNIQDISLNDIILFAVSRTLLNHKALNAHFVDDKMLLFKNVHLGVAVDTERGLMVPTIFDANLKSLNSISREAKNLAEGCRKGTIDPASLKGASFTVTNLGSFGIESFTPVLNPPQTGILGVCNIIQRIKLIDGQYVNYPAMGLSLTFDHRAIDGAPAARFLKELADNLENFTALLAK